jgi:hypothetical protein
MVPERRGRTPYANLRINTGEVWGGYRELLGEEEETGPDVNCEVCVLGIQEKNIFDF